MLPVGGVLPQLNYLIIFIKYVHCYNFKELLLNLEASDQFL